MEFGFRVSALSSSRVFSSGIVLTVAAVLAAAAPVTSVFFKSSAVPFVSRINSVTETLASVSTSPPPPNTTPFFAESTVSSTIVFKIRRWPNGGTVPGTYPHASMVSSRDASLTRLFAIPKCFATFLGSTCLVPFVTTTTKTPSHLNTKLFTICASSTRNTRALDLTSGVSSPTQRTRSTSPSCCLIQTSRSIELNTRDTWKVPPGIKSVVVGVSASRATEDITTPVVSDGRRLCATLPRILDASHADHRCVAVARGTQVRIRKPPAKPTPRLRCGRTLPRASV